MKRSVWALVRGMVNASCGVTFKSKGVRKNFWPLMWRKGCLKSDGGYQIIRFDGVPQTVAQKAVDGEYDTYEEYEKLRDNCEAFEIMHQEGSCLEKEEE